MSVGMFLSCIFIFNELLRREKEGGKEMQVKIQMSIFCFVYVKSKQTLTVTTMTWSKIYIVNLKICANALFCADPTATAAAPGGISFWVIRLLNS